MTLPLGGVTVVDFSTLLPGPLATLLLSRAGARVIKVERPPDGEDMRRFEPAFAHASASFALLNGGKETVYADLKTSDGMAAVRELLTGADVLVEQFRPGVMTRLGLGYEELAGTLPGLIYCSISGWGQTGPKCHVAGHDLNYQADAGLLALVTDPAGTPVLPNVLVADIGAGSYPAVMNVLLALIARERTGLGVHLDISMTDNLSSWAYWAQSMVEVEGRSPRPSDELFTGGSPRYAIYRTRDNRHLAVAPVEQRFWDVFCDVIGLSPEQRDDRSDPAAVIGRVAAVIRTRSAEEWLAIFKGRDVCVNAVRTVGEARAVRHRGTAPAERLVRAAEASLPALEVALVEQFQRAGDEAMP